MGELAEDGLRAGVGAVDAAEDERHRRPPATWRTSGPSQSEGPLVEPDLAPEEVRSFPAKVEAEEVEAPGAARRRPGTRPGRGAAGACSGPASATRRWPCPNSTSGAGSAPGSITSSRWNVKRCMVNACVGQRVAHIEQRMQAVSSLSMTPPRASSSTGSNAASCSGVIPSCAWAMVRSRGSCATCDRPTRCRQSSGHTSTQPLQAMHCSPSNQVCTSQRRQRSACRRASASG